MPGSRIGSHAIEEFSAALAIAPKYTLAFHRRGEAYLQMGDNAHAKSDFEAALSISAKFTPSIAGLRRAKRGG